mmetsp:Transcript_41227/g.119180  ORF Transcript_41227/g.119180 Transcript_41227/m.119180 type:complete len:104 (+) Transcript_41227:164-475(+)
MPLWHSAHMPLVLARASPWYRWLTSGSTSAYRLADELLKCKRERDFIRFAERQGASIKQGKHWVVKHPCGTQSTMSVNGNKNKSEQTRMKMFKEFSRIYKVEA